MSSHRTPASPSGPTAAHDTPPPGSRRTAARRARGAIASRPDDGVPRAVYVTIGLLLCVSPVLVLPGGKEGFRLVQGLVGGWLALASLVVASLMLRRTMAGGGLVRIASSIWHLPAARAALPLVAVVVAGGLFTTHPTHFRAACADFAIGAACLVGWSWALREERLRRLLAWTIPPAAIVAGLGLDQVVGWFGTLDFLQVQAPTARLRMTSTIGNPGDLASYVVLPLLVAASRLREARPRTRAALACGMAVMLAAIAASATLAAMAATIVGAAIASWCSMPRGRRRLLTAGIALALAVAVGAGALALSPPLRARVVEKIGALTRGDANALVTGRLDGWRAAMAMLRQAPATGVGQGAFRAEYADTRLRLAAAGVPFYAEQHLVMQATPHNEALSVGAEQGVPGLAALAWAIGCAIAAARRRTAARLDAPEGRARASRALAWSGLAALAVLSAVSFPLHVATIAWPWLLFLAWLLSPEALSDGPDGDARADAAPARADHPQAAWRTTRPRAFVAFVAVGALLLTALGWQTVRLRDRLTASRLLGLVEARTRAAVQARRAPSTLFIEHLTWLEEAARRDPLEIGVPIARGTQYLLLRRPDEALAAYREAAALEPRPEIDLNIGRALWMRGSKEEARVAFARAVRLSPTLRREVPEGGLD